MIDIIQAVIFLIFSINLGHFAWEKLHSNMMLLDYMRCDPNTWRFWDQLLLRLHKRPLSFQTLEAITWIVILNILYFVINPNGLYFLVFLVATVYISLSGYIRQAPLLPLLLLTAQVHPIFLIPLMLVKEVGGWLGLGVLLLQGDLVSALFYGGIAFCCYALLRLASGKERIRLEGTAPLFTPTYYLTALRKNRTLVLQDISVSAIIIVICFLQMPILSIWIAAPLILFSLPWEPHLWFPLFILIMGSV